MRLAEEKLSLPRSMCMMHNPHTMVPNFLTQNAVQLELIPDGTGEQGFADQQTEIAKQALVDNLQLKIFWLSIARQYFPQFVKVLSEYTLVWSTRPQKRTLASCNLISKRVTVAREMRDTSIIEYLEPLLYHEMCHAVIGMNVQKKNGRRSWHGAEFRGLESCHPGIVKLNTWIKDGGWSRAVRRDRALHHWKTVRNNKPSTRRKKKSIKKRIKIFLAEFF